MIDTRTSAQAVIAVMAAGLSSASAQEIGKVMIDVADCIKLEAPEARLACYESRVAAVFGERAAQAAAIRPAAHEPAAAAALRTPESAPATPPAPRATSAAAPATVSAEPAPAVTEPVQSRGDRQSRREENDRAAAGADFRSQPSRCYATQPPRWKRLVDLVILPGERTGCAGERPTPEGA